MKTLAKYQCEICNELYDSPEEAIQCESTGKEEPIAKVGDWFSCIIGYWGNDLDDPAYHDYRISKISSKDHIIVYDFEEELDGGIWQESIFSAYGNQHLLSHCDAIEEEWRD